MVGKDTEPKSSRIFHQCYVKCCKLQNLTPLTNVIPSGNGKVLDFCVDRIKYADWPPILNALSCDLSLHSVSIKCRQQIKTVLEHIDCERLAKTVNKRSVILTKFMLSNLVEATAQMLSNTTLLTTLLLEGFPLRIPYLNPLNEALVVNTSLQHIHLQRCLIGDAGCLAICKAIKSLPNILTLDLSGCELSPLGAGYIADLLKYQKIHRYSENWTHTLRYRLPELDTMPGLRRITVCANPQLGEDGVSKLLDVLSDDLWIKALDIQNCGITENFTVAILKMLTSNKTLVVIDLRNNELSSESLSKVRSVLRDNDRRPEGKFTWLASVSDSSSDRLLKSIPSKTRISKDRTLTNVRAPPTKYVTKTSTTKKEKDYTELLEEQLQEEISHRQQLEELNLQLVEQMKQLKQEQMRLWGNNGPSSAGSENSLGASSGSGDLSSSSGSSSPVPIDQNTLSYVQKAFKDIYEFIKNNQCYGLSANGQCPLIYEPSKENVPELLPSVPEQQPNVPGVKANVPERQTNIPELQPMVPGLQPITDIEDIEEVEEDTTYSEELRVNIVAKRPQSSHRMINKMKVNKTTRSAHLLGDSQRADAVDTKLEMIERHMGDTRNAHPEGTNTMEDNIISAQLKPKKKGTNGHISPSSSAASDSDTLTYSPQITQRSLHSELVNPRDAFYSSSSEDSS